MSKVPSRSFCSACKKMAHGKSCKRGKCECNFQGIPCRDLTGQQIKELKRIQRDDSDFVYSKESDDMWDALLKSFKHG